MICLEYHTRFSQLYQGYSDQQAAANLCQNMGIQLKNYRQSIADNSLKFKMYNIKFKYVRRVDSKISFYCCNAG